MLNRNNVIILNVKEWKVIIKWAPLYHQKLVFTRNDSRFPAQIYKGEQFEFMARESVKGTLKRK